MDDSHGLKRSVSSPPRQCDRSGVTALTAKWMAGLPQSLQPKEAAAHFPHVVNKLAALWPSPKACRQYFDEVLLDDRGDRQGFPVRVAHELVALQNHYDTVVHPSPLAPWVKIANRPFS